MRNVFAAWPQTGSWADHVGTPPGTGYSAGGEDYPTPYGTIIPAMAAGTIRNLGGLGEFKAGWVGSAGRRSILFLDEPIGDITAVVMQHLSKFPEARHYREGEDCFTTGASANGLDEGGEVHAHVHLLNAAGSRRQFTKYTNGTIGATYILGGDSDMPKIHTREDNKKTYFITPQRIMHVADAKELPALRYSAGYADKNAAVNEQIGKDDFRIVVQAYGFDYNKVAALANGQSLDLAGNVIPRNVWPGSWL